MNRLVVLTVAGLTVAVVGLTVALIVVASDSDGGSTTPTTLAPAVIGKDESKAKTVLREAGFEVASRLVPKNLLGLDTPRGVVLEQDPLAGSVAEPGSTVTLTVAGGN